MKYLLAIWLLLIPIGFFMFLLGLSIDKQKLTNAGAIVLGVFFILAMVLFIGFLCHELFIRG